MENHENASMVSIMSAYATDIEAAALAQVDKNKQISGENMVLKAKAKNGAVKIIREEEEDEDDNDQDTEIIRKGIEERAL